MSEKARQLWKRAIKERSKDLILKTILVAIEKSPILVAIEKSPILASQYCKNGQYYSILGVPIIFLSTIYFLNLSERCSTDFLKLNSHKNLTEVLKIFARDGQ